MALTHRWLPSAARRAIRRRWSAQLLAMLGVDASVRGLPPRPGMLVVSNHISWLDVFVINAQAPCVFVCKAEVRSWPLVGWLCAHSDTVFLERGRLGSTRDVAAGLTGMLASGAPPVAVFPEGTTSDGRDLLPFKPALIQSAIDADAVIAPLALRYTDRHNRPNTDAAYVGEASLADSMWRIALSDGLRARAEWLPPVHHRGASRGELALRLQRSIRLHLAPARRQHQGLLISARKSRFINPDWAFSAES